MKILHTADWHLGNTFHGHSRLEEHKHFLSWLLEQLDEHQPDALLIAGDVYDSPNPSAAAEELFYDFLLHATGTLPGLQVVITAGNHDSAGRLEAPAALLKTHNVYVRGTIHYTPGGTPDYDYYLLPLASRQNGEAECVCMALPYLRGGDYPAGLTPEEGLRHFFDALHKAYRRSAFNGLPLVACAHFYASGADISNTEHSERLVVGGQDCVGADVTGNDIRYTALGHIHKAQAVRETSGMYYAGSALPMSFSELHYRHGIQLVEMDGHGRCEVRQLPYEPLRRLACIPADGGAADVRKAMDDIAALPVRKKGDAGSAWPYLELRIREQQPEPTLMHDIMEALQDKAVHFCRIQRVVSEGASGRNGKAGNETDRLPALDQTDPLGMARKFFDRRFASPMPEALVERFRKAEAAARENH